jgi:hypothetical protein
MSISLSLAVKENESQNECIKENNYLSRSPNCTPKSQWVTLYIATRWTENRPSNRFLKVMIDDLPFTGFHQEDLAPNWRK